MFACTLALRLGMTVSQVLDMPNGEFNLWQAFNRFNPLSDVRKDLNAAMICAAVTNVHVKKGRQVKPAMFMPKWGPTINRPEKFDKKALFAALDGWVEKDKRHVTKHTDH